MQFVRITDPDKRAYLVATVQQVSDGFVLEQGDNVVLDSTALNTLRYVDLMADGHYDGAHVWIGGTEYDVAEVDPQPEPEPEGPSEPLSAGPAIRWWTPQIPGPSFYQRIPAPAWPDGWPIPQIGQTIHVTRPQTGEWWELQVHSVQWYPVAPDDDQPHVYVVLDEIA